jgi:biopolymer transport protein ExbB/TolQ
VLPEISKILSNPINVFVLGWLGLYLFFVFFVFFYKFFSLTSWIKKERESLNALLMSGNISGTSSFKRCIDKSENESSLVFDACIEAAKTKASGELTFLSIVASTSPFIGLFGTVIGILTAFSSMQSVTTINMIAPAIADALVATAVGIIVAVPAYSFHQILGKKVEDLLSLLIMQKDFYLSK